MQIGNKLFPYPTLNNDGLRSCFKETTYSFECVDSNDGKNYLLENAHIEINNDNIKKMIENEMLGVGLIVECSATVYRKMFEIGLEPKNISIPIGELRDKVVISCYVYAKKDIDSYFDNDFLEEYNGYTFKIEKNDIIAIDDGFTAIIDYDEDVDKKVSSIFQIIRDRSTDAMGIEMKTKKIIITLPDNEFNNYNSLRATDNYQNIIFAMMAIPALEYCLKELQDRVNFDEVDIDSIEMDYQWFISVKNAYKKMFDKELTDEEFKQIEVTKVSQKLLNDGNINAIRDLFEIATKKNLIGGEDDE
ncbi:MAG: hypothetical protein HG450_001780 [Clostridiales bacterium]|nr:hypothetical protein [Clostridiales bacterium]